MKKTLSQTMIAAALLGLFAHPARSVDMSAERAAPGFQLKVITLTPKLLEAVKPGDGVTADPLAAALRAALSVDGAIPEGARLVVAIPSVGSRAEAAVPRTEGPAASATLAVVEKAVEGMPDLVKAGGGQAHAGGQTLSDAVTGGKTVSGTGDVSAAPEPSAPAVPLKEAVAQGKAVVDGIKKEVGKVIVGQDNMIQSIIMALIARQHVLLEGLPGVGKTETAKAFADAVHGAFQRVQGTPDKLPSDILGAEILQEDPATGKKEFQLAKGPVFTNILLVDEINRMPPKAQAALLEAMAEGRVTIGRQTLDLMRFTVLATQNPVEQDGTYRLPEAQLDRFMFKVLVPQPSASELKVIMERNRSKDSRPTASKVTSLTELDKIRKTAESIPMDSQIEDYIVRIVMAAKEHDHLKGSVEYSVYTRAAIFMAQAARIHALMSGRDWVGPDDVRAVAPLVMRHRIVLNYQANGTTPDQIIEKILDLVSPPRPTTPARSQLKAFGGAARTPAR
ncbi:MAG: MoxR family ATPase [Elusimicrobia bacterium]|nr:MoxR family ATPase [Elusimicrobiota bacterium]